MCKSIIWRAPILLMALFCLEPVSAAPAASVVPATIGNPQPTTEDFILPMPCGQQLVFRKVIVPSDGLLGDRRIIIGGSDERFRLMENSRTDYVAGGFFDTPAPAQRYYFIGKYEITEAQYNSVSRDCPGSKPAQSLPATSMSWFDAVAFTQRYTEWLLKNAATRLPKNDNAVAFVRLPTEAEWEYAVRGGSTVKEADFIEPLFPMKEPLARYAWYQSTQSANGKLQPIGLLKPNPLGLHDMLGNADEMVLDEFRLNKLSRPHGQAGGFVAKGGNFLTSESDMRSSYRQEIPFYDSNGAKRIRTLGFRVVISSVVVTSPQRLSGLREEWSQLPQTEGFSGATLEVDPIEELAAVTKNLPDVGTRQRLQNLGTALASNISARNEQRDRAAKGMLRLGAFLALKLKDDNRLLITLRTLNEARQKATMDPQVRAAAEQRLQDSEKTMLENLSYYADNVISAAQDYSRDVLMRAQGVFSSEINSQNIPAVATAARIYLSHIEEYRRTKRPDRAKWLKEISS
jgi:hypothetical protein